MKDPISKFGIRMEMAKGKEAAETPAAMTAAERQGDEISLEDPILQRSLNALQLIDAIAGQLDRHWHNYYVATEGGRVTGVVGIDLDMAFAVDHRGVEPVPVDRQGRQVTKANFVGMPLLVDSAFAQKILAVNQAALQSMLETYLSPAEVDSTMERFRLVRQSIVDIQNSDKIVADWNADTASRQRDPKTSYLGKMQEGVIAHEFAGQANTVLRSLFDRKNIGQANVTKQGIPLVIDQLVDKMKTGQLTIQEGNQLIHKLNQLADESPSINANLNRLRQMEQRGLERAQPLIEQLNALKEQKKALQSRDINDPERIDISKRIQDLEAETNRIREGDPNFKNNLRTDLMDWVRRTALSLVRKPVADWGNFRPLPILNRPIHDNVLAE